MEIQVDNGSRAAQEDTGKKQKYLTFVLGEQSYGIEIEYVTEIIGMQGITPVPDMPMYVQGVINLRGKVIPIMDVRTRFGLAHREHDNRTCTVVIKVQNADVGLVVDTVQEVLDIPSKDIEPPPDLTGGGGGGFVKAMAKVGDDVKILLDAAALIFRGHSNSNWM